MCKFRTIQKACEYIKSIDPESDITECLIRRLATQEKISIAKSGRKVLVNVDSLMDYLSGIKFTPSIVSID